MVLAPGHQEGGLEEGRLRLSFGHPGPPYCRINPEPSDQWGDAWRPLGSPGHFSHRDFGEGRPAPLLSATSRCHRTRPQSWSMPGVNDSQKGRLKPPIVH
jgi:hypothetical protein